MNVSRPRPPLFCLPVTPRRSDYFFLFFSAAHASQRPKRLALALERRRGCVPSRFRLRRLQPDVPTRYTVRLVFYQCESERFESGRRADEGTTRERVILPLLAAQSVISSTSDARNQVSTLHVHCWPIFLQLQIYIAFFQGVRFFLSLSRVAPPYCRRRPAIVRKRAGNASSIVNERRAVRKLLIGGWSTR